MITIKQVHKEIIDYLGKNSINWEPNKLKVHWYEQVLYNL